MSPRWGYSLVLPHPKDLRSLVTYGEVVTQMHHQHDPDLIECRECEAQFDLARQSYYTNLCPSCYGGGA